MAQSAAGFGHSHCPEILAALFALGIQPFQGFVKHVIEQTSTPYIWIGNMSAKSFATQALPGNPTILMAIIFGP